MSHADPFGDRQLIRLQLLLYLMPFVGIVPSAWTLSRKTGDREGRSLARLSLNLTLGWLLAYGLLWTGSTMATDTLSLRLLYLNALLTSGYVLLSLGMMRWQLSSQPLVRKLSGDRSPDDRGSRGQESPRTGGCHSEVNSRSIH
jgi:hypothetical protein